MKRETNLWNSIPEWGNLESALAKAIRGNRTAREGVVFREGLPDTLAGIAIRVREERGPVGDYREFTIHDPKERVISAPCFADRVLHHAVMNVCEPAFERWLIDQTFACRVGLGTSAAIAEAAKWSSTRRWYLQLDVRHYFETVPRARAYARYMDDLVLWHDDKLLLLDARDRILGFAENELGLEMKEPILNRTSMGMNYLGFRFHPGWTGLAPRSRRRLRERIRTYERLWVEGRITELELQQRATAALAFAAPALTRRMGTRLSTIDY